MKDFGWGGGPEREPVADPVRNGEGRALLAVEPGPVTEEGGAKAEVGIEHQLAAVGVSSQHQWEARLGGRIKRVGVVGQEDREGGRIPLSQKLLQGG